MTSFTSSSKANGQSGGAPRRRRRFPAISGIHLLIVAAGVLALVGNLVLLRGGETPLTHMAVSGVDLAPGRILQPEDIQLTPLDVAEPIASGLISEAELSEYEGWVVAGQTAAGSLIRKASLRAPLTTLGFRAMSFPINAEHAAGGDLIPGDLVDVIRVDKERAFFVATAVPVLAVSTQSEGALGLSGGGFYLVLEVDERTALALALALSHAEVEVLRSTGSTPVVVHVLEESSGSVEDPPSLLGAEVDSIADEYLGSERYSLTEGAMP